MSDLTPKQKCLRAILDDIRRRSGAAPTAPSTGYVVSSETLSLLDERSVPYSQARNKKPPKLGYKSCYTLSLGDARVASVPTASEEITRTVLQEGLGIRGAAKSIMKKLRRAVMNESDAARDRATRRGGADAGKGMLDGLLHVELDSTNGPFCDLDLGIHCNADVLAEVKAKIAERNAKTDIDLPSVELSKDTRSAFSGAGLHGMVLSALLKVGAEVTRALFNDVNLACIDLSHAENPLGAFRYILCRKLLNTPKYDGDFDSVSLNAGDSEGKDGWGQLTFSGPNKTAVTVYCHPRTIRGKRNAELVAHLKPLLVALRALCQRVEKTLGEDNYDGLWKTEYVPWIIKMLNTKADFDKREYGPLCELCMIKNRIEVLQGAQPVEQRPAQIARSEASADVSDESSAANRAAIFKQARTTSMWNVVSPHIMPFLEWDPDYET